VSLTNTYENYVLDAMLGGHRSDRFPATVYAVLFTALPAEDGTGGTEPAGGAYAPVAVANDTAHWPDAASLSP
jgi:hypothetical protein